MVISSYNYTSSPNEEVDQGTTKVISATWTSNLKNKWEDIPNFSSLRCLRSKRGIFRKVNYPP